MSYQPKPHEQLVIDNFTLRRAEPPTRQGNPKREGKSVIANVRLYLYPNGTIHLCDDRSNWKEIYGDDNGTALADAQRLFGLLCERGIALAKSFQEQEHSDTPRRGDH